MLRPFWKVLDLLPYFAVVLAYPALIFRTAGEAPEAPPTATELWWHELNVDAVLLYVPAMIVCALLEWLARRHSRPRALIAVRTARWLHFAFAFWPLFVFAIHFAGYEIAGRLRGAGSSIAP